jgi:hypothetical protein
MSEMPAKLRRNEAEVPSSEEITRYAKKIRIIIDTIYRSFRLRRLIFS